MKTWAKLNNDRIVTDILVAEESQIVSGILGHPMNFIETSTTAEFRKNYAAVGYYYDMMRNAFIPPKSYPSWIFDEEKCIYKAPVDAPEGLSPHEWNEGTQTWDVWTP